MGYMLPPWKEDERRVILQDAINKAAEDPATDAVALRGLWDEVETARLTKTEMYQFRCKLRRILKSVKKG